MPRLSVIVTLLYTLVVTVHLINYNYVLSRDLEAVAHRAQVAADAQDMLHYMQTLKTNMEQHNLTHGNTALIFKSPSNDLSLLYESVNNIIDRLEQIQELPKRETAYQVALDDLRGTIRELESPTAGVVWVDNWILIWLYAIWIWPIVHFIRDDFESW